MKKTTKPAARQAPEKQAHRQGAGGRGLPWLVRLWLVLLGLAVGQPAPVQATGHGQAEEVFIKVRVVPGQANIYAGQALTISYLLYHRVPLIEPDNDVNLTFKNCLVEEYPALVKASESKETIGGHVYQVSLIKKYLVVPQLEGALQIPALAQHYSFSAPPAPADFFEEQRIVSKTIRSTASQLLVRPLPLAGDSVAFCQAVGQFQFQPTYTISRKTDNLLTVRLQVAGTGSLKQFKLPPPTLPAGLDVFNVHSEVHDTLTASGLQTISAYSYEVLAAYRGTYTLPGLSLAYFDPVAGRYVSFSGPAFRWRVGQGPPPPRAASLASPPAGPGQGLYTKNALTETQADYLFLGSGAYYASLLVAGVLFLGGLGYTQWANARRANRKQLTFRKAKRRATQALRRIGQAPVTTTDAYYKELTDILITYLGDKLDLSPLAIAYHDLPLLLAAAGVPALLQGQTIAYLSQLRRLRFSAGQLAAQPTGFYSQELLTLIQQLDACLRYNLSSQLVGAAA